MAPIVGKDYSMTRVLPILEALLKDDSSEVRLNVSSNMAKLAGVVGPDLLTPTLITTFTNLTKDAQWRVRMATVELLGDLSLNFGKDVFMQKIEPIFIQYLTNTAASVREMGIKKSAEIGEKFRAEWVMSAYLPKVIENYNVDQQGYMYRICSLRSLSAIMPVLQKDQITDKVVPIILKATSDPIPNVQFCVSKIIYDRRALFD